MYLTLMFADNGLAKRLPEVTMKDLEGVIDRLLMGMRAARCCQ